MTTNIEKLVEDLSNISILDAVELVNVLQTKWDLGQIVIGGGSVPAESSTEKVVEEKTAFDVELINFGDQKIKVIKAVRELTGLTLKEAKDLVDSAPKMMKSGVTKTEAEQIKEKIEAQGGKIEIK